EQILITSLGEGVAVKGTISAIAPAADLQTMTFPLEITIDNAERKIKSGMFGEVDLGQDRVKNAIIIPQEALVTIDGEKVVFVVKDGLAELRKVQTGIENDEMLQIKSGVAAGETVVTRGNASLRDGLQVEIRSDEQAED
ncbi:MAG: efflux RND transporter periplasmic adaptor subunit, partial [Clostridia bacterium]|nr:efflux RND transporter periplasmic adaptor subunit [Clostridia bacterium]